MIQVQFPEPNFKTRSVEGGDEIFDAIRKRWLVLSPEEWVRQNFISWLLQVHNIPPSLVGLEREIKVGELKKRFDIVIFKNDGRPWLLVECKAMGVPLTEKTVQQTLGYLSGMACPYISITNGKFTYLWGITDKGFVMMNQFPRYNNLV